MGEAAVTGQAEAFMFRGNQPFKPWWDDSLSSSSSGGASTATLPLAAPRAPPTQPTPSNGSTSKQMATPIPSQQQLTNTNNQAGADDVNIPDMSSNNHYLLGIVYALLGWETMTGEETSNTNGTALTSPKPKKVLQPPIPST